jgi:hypothetical protein
MPKMKLISLSRLTFFGLSDSYSEYVYEQLFYLKHYGGWSFIESYSLPVQLREWWVKRIGKEFQREKDDMEKSQNKNASLPYRAP